MDLRELETFVKVAELKNFSKTAEELNVTQPTITNHIQNLEKNLKTILMDRRGREVILTDSGHLLHKYAIDIINSCAMAEFQIKEMKEDLRGVLNIESCAVPRKYFLPKLLKDFLEANPKISFNIRGGREEDSLSKLRKRQLDFALVGYQGLDPDIDFIKIGEEEMVFITSSQADYENYQAIEAEELLNHRLILKEKSNQDLQCFCNKLQDVSMDMDSLDIVGYCDDLDTIKSLVELGVGSAFLSKKSIETDVEAGRYKAVYIKGLDLDRQFYLAYSKHRHMHIIDQLFKEYILEKIR